MRAAALFALVFLTACASAPKEDPWLQASRQAIFVEQAAAIIERANAQAWFDPETDGVHVIARHRASGLVCDFEPDAPATITIFPTATYGAAPGEDVACNSGDGGGVRTLYATRYPDQRTLDVALARVLEELFQAYPDAQSFERREGLSDDNDEPLPESRTAHFILPAYRGVEGRAYSRASVAVIAGWVILMRYTGPEGADTEAAADYAWARALIAIQQRPGGAI